MTILLSVLALLLFVTLPVSAESDEALADAYDRFLAGIPSDVAALLPEDLFRGDPEELYGIASEVSGFSWLLEKALDVIGAEMVGAIALLGRLLAILVAVSVARTVKSALGSEALARSVELCATAVVVGLLLSLVGDAVAVVSRFFERLTALVGSTVPVTGVLLAMGGNVGTAVTTGSGMMIFLGILEHLAAATLLPVSGVSAAIAVSDALFGGGRLRGLSGFIKKVYTYFLGVVMLLLTFSLSVQTSLSASADGVAIRSAKMLAGRVIPVVGSAVGETLRTVAGSVGYLKSTVGAIGVVAVLLLTLPPLVTVALYRLGLIAASAVAELLGCTPESKLLDSFVTVFGYLLAVTAISAVTTIFLLTLFVKCAVALG